MAYVVSRPGGRWELRRSASTPAGPRSETLVGFSELTAEAIEHAVERSGGALTADDVRAAARRAGAPIALDPARGAAARLMRELSRGARLPDSWRAPLLALVGDGEGERSGAHAIAEWAGAGAQRRGEALRDLLLLADALPSRRPGPLSFPGFATDPE